MKFRHILFLVFAILLSACKVQYSIANESVASVLDFGADPTGKKDASNAFQKAINSNVSRVMVPKGRYLINQTVEISSYLFLEAGVHIIRTEQEVRGPIFWLNKSKAVLEGAHRGVIIESYKTSSEGLIKIGHGSDTKNKGNILYCSLKNLTLKGNGEDQSKGVLLYNSQEKGDPNTASYFHNIQNLIIEYVGTGIHLLRMSNANSINQIYFNRVGRGKQSEAVLIEGAMENRIHDCFHHFSPNAVTIRMLSYDNLYPMYNYIYGVVAEQGGEEAVCLDVESGLHNIIEVNCNAVKGNKIFKEFYNQKNSLIAK